LLFAQHFFLGSCTVRLEAIGCGEKSMANWQWQQLNDHPYLTCDLLADWQHGFLSRHFAPQSPTEITTQMQPLASSHQVKQIHGNVVLTPTCVEAAINKELETGLALADGLVSDGDQQALWVASADCNPVLLADTHTGMVSAVHAGWRGTAQGIVGVAVNKLLALGTTPANLRVAIGPAIDGEVYQVTTGVGAEVCLSILPEMQGQEPTAIVDRALALADSPLLPDEQPGRIRLDVRRVNWWQLRQLGLTNEQISIAPHCTFQEPNNFFSYRREKLKKIQWSGIIAQAKFT
jgi:polyphenol oxidase